LTKCGVKDVIVESGDSFDDAYAKYKFHVAMKHSPMKLLKIEQKSGNFWYDTFMGKLIHS
jgi:hypothetical protein